MRGDFQRLVALVLCELLVFLPRAGAQPSTRSTASSSPAPVLRNYLNRSYRELFQMAPKLEFTPSEYQSVEESLKSGKSDCIKRFKELAHQYDEQMQADQKILKDSNAHLDDEQRHNLHCKIQNLRAEKSAADVLASNGIPVAYENLRAKLQLLENWPAQQRLIDQQIRDKSYLQRRWGDVKDVGFRQIARGQEDDIKTGQRAIEEMKRQGMMPHEVDNKAIQEYVNSVAQLVAAHSDLHIPLHVTVLNSKEINAFALPGGYLFVERGLLEAADDEAELAGVIGHEIAHDTARHANKLMHRAEVAGLLFQAAQIAGLIFTGGITSIGMYYALEYGYYGLGLVLDLRLLGVSREYELQADQLGIQYVWNAGYDPNGFIRFFDKIATKEGYANGLSWFRTHPPFFERMVNAEREIQFLPKKPQLVVQTSAFEQMKKELVSVVADAQKRQLDKPSLLEPEKGCPAPKELKYKPGQPIEDFCAAAPLKSGT